MIYYVDAINGDDKNDGTSVETAYKTITKYMNVAVTVPGGSLAWVTLDDYNDDTEVD